MADGELQIPVRSVEFDETTPPGLSVPNGVPEIILDDVLVQPFRFEFRVPSRYASAPRLIFQWSMPTGTSGNIALANRAWIIPVGQDKGTPAYQAQDKTADIAVPLVARTLVETTLTLATVAGITAGASMVLEMTREAASVSNASGDVAIHSPITFVFTET